MNLILLGAPGAGKGTQAELLMQHLNIPSISTGNMLREAMANGSELGKQVKQCMEEGRLVSDDLVMNLVAERTKQADCKNGFILDGFPRSIPHAEALDAMGIKMDVVLSLEVADEKIVERMSGRRVCHCGASYHVAYLPPKTEGICDKCGAELYIRDDDAEATVRKRLDTFHAQTEPLKDYYGAKGILVTVQGREEVEDTSAAVLAALSEVKCAD